MPDFLKSFTVNPTQTKPTVAALGRARPPVTAAGKRLKSMLDTSVSAPAPSTADMPIASVPQVDFSPVAETQEKLQEALAKTDEKKTLTDRWNGLSQTEKGVIIAGGLALVGLGVYHFTKK